MLKSLLNRMIRRMEAQWRYDAGLHPLHDQRQPA